MGLHKRCDDYDQALCTETLPGCLSNCNPFDLSWSSNWGPTKLDSEAEGLTTNQKEVSWYSIRWSEGPNQSEGRRYWMTFSESSAWLNASKPSVFWTAVLWDGLWEWVEIPSMQNELVRDSPWNHDCTIEPRPVTATKFAWRGRGQRDYLSQVAIRPEQRHFKPYIQALHPTHPKQDQKKNLLGIIFPFNFSQLLVVLSKERLKFQLNLCLEAFNFLKNPFVRVRV